MTAMEITQTQAGLVVHAAQMGGFLTAFGLLGDEEHDMAYLEQGGFVEYVGEPGQVAYFQLTDTGRQVAESLGVPF